MRVVTRPRTSESEKPVEKTKEEGEEVSSAFTCTPPPHLQLHLWGPL